MKKIISAFLCGALVLSGGSSVFAAAVDSAKEDMDTQIITVTGSNLAKNDKVLIEIFNFDGENIDYENGLEGVFAVQTDNNGKYSASFKLPKIADTGMKKIFAKPIVGEKGEAEVDFYSSSSIETILQNWNDAIENQSKASMENVVNDKTALKIILNSPLVDKLCEELLPVSKDSLTQKLLTLSKADKIGDFAPDFIAPYINFAINNLSADTLSKLVLEFYDSIDTQKDAVYENIIAKMSDEEKMTLFKDAAAHKTANISTEDFASLIYNRAVYNKFTAITYFTEIKPFIETYNTDYFKIDFSDYNLITNTYNVDSKAITNRHEYTDFATFKTKYEGWINDEKTAEQIANSTSSGKGSGGGGKTGATVPFLPTPADEDISIVKEEIFHDLDGFDWAKEHIMALYNNGSLDGVSKDSFAPSDTVTREQFVKLISALTSLDEKAANAEFSDVKAGEWYEKYINSAKSIGLISGKDDNTFGVGENITRQDAAVMIFNAVKKERADITDKLEIGKLEFKDAGDISSYAIYAVSALNKLGIINGDNLGFVNPNATATRAEAAVMISKALTLIGEGA